MGRLQNKVAIVTGASAARSAAVWPGFRVYYAARPRTADRPNFPSGIRPSRLQFLKFSPPCR
jgi:hypothetical protein